MADSVVRLLVDARNALTGLRQTNKESEKLKRAFTALSSEAKKVKGAVEANNAGFVKLSQVQGVFSAKVRNTEVAIRAQIRALRDVQSRVELGGSIYQKAGQKIAAYEARLRSATEAKERASRRSRVLSGAFTGLTGVVSKAALVFGAFKAAQIGVSRVESERRLRLLGERFGEVSQLQLLAAQNADKFNLSQTESNQALANVFARLRPLGVSLADINSTFAGFRTAAILGGATAQEASASFTQLSQALGSGALRGDEFRSVAEQAPLVLQAISDETGIAAGELKDYAKEGLLTSDIVIKALKRIETEGADQLTEALGGPAAAIKDFQNAAEDVAAAVTEAIVPEMATTFTNLAELIRNLAGPIRFIGGVIGQVLSDINGLIDMVTKSPEVAARRAIERGNLPSSLNFFNPNEGAEKLFGKEGLQDLRQQSVEFARLRNQPEQQVLIELMQNRLKAMDGSHISSVALSRPEPTSTITRLPKSSKSKGGSGKTEAEKLRDIELDIMKAQDQQNKRIEERNMKFTEMDTKLQFQLMLSQATTDEQRKQIENDMLKIDMIKRYGYEEGMIFYQRQIQTQENNEARAQEKKDLQELTSLQEQAAQKIAQRYKAIGDAIKTGIVDSISAAVFQTQSLAEVATNTLNNLANQLLNMGIQMALGGLGTALGGPFAKLFPGLAEGGRAQAGRSYIVGEKGPELFTPGGTGTVTPNHALMGGGSIVVNVDASGSAVEGEGAQAKQLGNVIGVAVRQELLKQKRPGGLLA